MQRENNINKVYIDGCDNIKTFLMFEKITHKKNNVKIKKINKILTIIKYKIYSKFNIFKLIKDKVFVLYFNDINNKKTRRKIEKFFSGIEKENYKIILSDYLIKKLELENNININKVVKENKQNKTIFINKILEIVKYFIEMRKETEQENNIYILVKGYNEKINNLLIKLAINYKSLNIITDDIQKYKILEEYIYKKYEIPIIINNNRKKALSKARYIINISYNENEINEYIVNREAVIFNISKQQIKNIRGFQGIIVNNIEVKKIDKKNNNSIKHLNRRFFHNLYNNEKVEIINLLGNSGKIDKQEIVKNSY